jgi:uncharacterized protein (TIGR03067 family)
MTVRAVLPVLVVLAVVAAEPAKDAKEELDKLQGEWTMVSLEQKGKKAPEDMVKRYRLTIKGDQWAVSIDGMAGSVITFKIDPAKSPREIDMVLKMGDRESVSKGIYKLEGDTLTLCRTVGDVARPKEFKTTAEAGVLVVWKRAPK